MKNQFQLDHDQITGLVKKWQADAKALAEADAAKANILLDCAADLLLAYSKSIMARD